MLAEEKAIMLYKIITMSILIWLVIFGLFDNVSADEFILNYNTYLDRFMEIEDTIFRNYTQNYWGVEYNFSAPHDTTSYYSFSNLSLYIASILVIFVAILNIIKVRVIFDNNILKGILYMVNTFIIFGLISIVFGNNYREFALNGQIKLLDISMIQVLTWYLFMLVTVAIHFIIEFSNLDHRWLTVAVILVIVFCSIAFQYMLISQILYVIYVVLITIFAIFTIYEYIKDGVYY